MPTPSPSGSHIFFGQEQYQPDTSTGKELIAHELTHTVQQGASAPAAKVQREEKKSWWESFTEFSEDFVWGVVRSVAPSARAHHSRRRQPASSTG